MPVETILRMGNRPNPAKRRRHLRKNVAQDKTPVESKIAEMPENEEIPQQLNFKLTVKEWFLLIFATGLALAAFKAQDPFVLVPMLVLSGVTFCLLCYCHAGNGVWRSLTAIALLATLTFVGWRDLRTPQGFVATVPKERQSTQELIRSLVQYAELNRVTEISDELALNLRVQMQRQKYLSTNPSVPFNYFQFGLQVTYRAREGNWGGGVITPGMPLSALGVHERPNEVSFLVESPKMSEDTAQLRAFSGNLLLPPAIKWDLDRYIETLGESDAVIADILNDYAQKGHIFSPSDQDVLEAQLSRRLKPLSVPLERLESDARQYIRGY